SYLLLVNDHPLCARIARRLRQQGQPVVSVRAGVGFTHDLIDEYTVHPGQSEDFDRLIEELVQKGRGPRQIVHLWNLREGTDEPWLEELPVMQDRAYFSLTALGRALGKHIQREPLRLAVVTNGAARVLAEEPLVRPESALSSGPCKVIPTEYR